MAKRRKTARKSAAKRPAKRRGTRTAKLKGRKVAKPRRAKARKRKGMLAGALDAVREAAGLRSRLEGRNTFED
jgi:hypothetical protein